MAEDEFTHTIVHNPQARHDGAIFVSAGSKTHKGKRARKLRSLTAEDEQFAHEHDPRIAQTVVETEDGHETTVLNDELVG
jgi:hypothetical protein